MFQDIIAIDFPISRKLLVVSTTLRRWPLIRWCRGRVLDCVRWRSPAGLAWHWLLWTADQISEPLGGPSLILRFSHGRRDSENTNVGPNQVLSCAHLESKPYPI